MAEVLDTTVPTLTRWLSRVENRSEPSRPGRPKVIPEAARQRIRACYVAHYGQWGPQVLALWCRRQGVGHWCASTIADVITDLRDQPEDKPDPIRYEITASQVMWSEDGAGFQERGKKKELLILQDEHARFKVNHRLVDGPANGDDVIAYLREAFDQYGPPLVLKHDGDSIFHTEAMTELLKENQVIDLTAPPHYAPYNGKKERSIRDVKSYDRAMRRHGVRGRLSDRLNTAIWDLNEERPRPMLGGRTAREVFELDRIELPDRVKFREEVDLAEHRWKAAARSRSEQESTRRRAIEEVLLAYCLMKRIGDVSTNCEAQTRTN
jgi:hypothetical protein